MCKNKTTGMVKKRMKHSKKLKFRVRKVEKHSLFMKNFVVSASLSSKTNYTVTICANPPRTCQDNRKYGKSVFWKYIMFVLLLKILVQQCPNNDPLKFVYSFWDNKNTPCDNIGRTSCIQIATKRDFGKGARQVCKVMRLQKRI